MLGVSEAHKMQMEVFMLKSNTIKSIFITVSAIACIAFSANAAEVEIKMLNKGSDGSITAFEPAFVKIAVGDSVHFISADKGHNAESIANMIPDGATPFAGKTNEEIVVKFDKAGVYGYRCKPHFPMGMVGLIEVGNPINEDAAKAATASMGGAAKNKFSKLFAQLDSSK